MDLPDISVKCLRFNPLDCPRKTTKPINRCTSFKPLPSHQLSGTCHLSSFLSSGVCIIERFSILTGSRRRLDRLSATRERAQWAWCASWPWPFSSCSSLVTLEEFNGGGVDEKSRVASCVSLVGREERPKLAHVKASYPFSSESVSLFLSLIK